MAAKSGTYVKYHREERIEIGKFALNNGVASAVRHFVTKYPRLCRSSCRNLKDKYKESLRAEKRILNNQSSGTENPARMYQQKRFVRKAHKGSYMKFSDADRDIIAKAVIELGAPAALQKYKPFFPRLRESTCRYLRDRYIKSLGLSPKDIKSRNFLSKFTSNVSLTQKQVKSGLNHQDVESRDIFDSHSPTGNEDIHFKNTQSPKATSASYTIFSDRDQLTTNDINNSAGNYENFGQRNLRNEPLEGETLLAGQHSVNLLASRGHMSKIVPTESIDSDKKRITKTAIRMTKGRYNKFCREEREEIGKYAYMYGATKAMRQLRDKYPQLRESTCRHLRDKYMSVLKEEQKEHMQTTNIKELSDEQRDINIAESNSNISSEYLGEGVNDEDDGSNGAASYSSFDSNSDYLQKEETPTVIPEESHLPDKSDFGITDNSGNSEDRALVTANTKKRGQYNKYDEDDRCEIGMFAAENGIVTTLRHFKDRFPNLNESTCRNFRDKYNISMGIEVSTDVSEFDPVSFVDVYSNVKLSDNSEGILTKTVSSGDSGSPTPALTQAGKRGGFVPESEIFQSHQKDGVNLAHPVPIPASSNPERMQLVPLSCTIPGEEPIVVPKSSTFNQSYDSLGMMSDSITSHDDYQDCGDMKQSSNSSQKSKVKRGSYCKFNEDAKIEIGKFASRYGVSRTYMHFQPKYPRLKESTCRYFKELYEKELKWKDTQDTGFSNRSGPNIIIRPSSHFERMRKPITVKTARIPGAPTDRFPAPATIVNQRQVSVNSGPVNQHVSVPRPEARGNFSFMDPSTNLHISNVESLSSDQIQSSKPVRIKIEDEDDEVLEPAPSNRQSARAAGSIQQAQGGALHSPPVSQNLRTVESDVSNRHAQHTARAISESPSGMTGNEKDDTVSDYLDVNRESEIGFRSEGQKKRGQYMAYNHEDRVEIGRFATENGPSPALKHFRGKYPRISESTVRYFRHKYLTQRSRSEIGTGDGDSGRRLSNTTERLINIDEAEASIVRFLKLLQEEGGSIGIPVALSISRGIIEAKNKSLLTEYGGSFTLTKGWMKSVLARHSLNSDISY